MRRSNPAQAKRKGKFRVPADCAVCALGSLRRRVHRSTSRALPFATGEPSHQAHRGCCFAVVRATREISFKIAAGVPSGMTPDPLHTNESRAGGRRRLAWPDLGFYIWLVVQYSPALPDSCDAWLPVWLPRTLFLILSLDPASVWWLVAETAQDREQQDHGGATVQLKVQRKGEEGVGSCTERYLLPYSRAFMFRPRRNSLGWATEPSAWARRQPVRISSPWPCHR
jgi:hypothetical protein